jgi:hypothetical protein|tara:strand:- start:6652 stop:7812 length:1161 start_codon:yes stop_codon:yes gene_type:complete
MASTFSDLKIELIATGEQSGVWGATTNVNLGTALQEAITGSADVTFSSGNVTLTLTDTNAAQVGRNLRLNLTGTTGGARDLVLPAIEKLYLINNGTADIITCKNASGTTVAVPAATSTFIYNTSTNVVDATSYLSTLSLGSALAVTSGGTGATSAGAARTALGTAAAGANSDITSLTGLTTALTVAQGGTGAATHTANAVLIGEGTAAISSVAPGTSGNVLTSNGTDWTSGAAAAFDTGTRMIFGQNAAPTGWSKDTTNYNQHAMRIVTGTAGGTGGTVDFTSAFTSQAVAGSVSITGLAGSAGATTLSTPQIPSHTHTYSKANPSPAGGGKGASVGAVANANTGATGGGGSHTHPFSFSSGTATFSGSAIDLAVKYFDVITATKD